MNNIFENLTRIRQRITNAEQKYKREPGAVTLVAVSKSQSIEKIKQAVEQKQFHFGESYLQEALPKINFFIKNQLIWHYIGRIQTKKIKLIAKNFDWVESVIDFKTAQLLNNYRDNDMPLLNICIQVNISDEVTKSGVSCNEILPLAEQITTLPMLSLRGLMAIPEQTNSFERQFSIFKKLADELYKLKNHGLSINDLSIGMSGDFEAAIAAGATMVRIGSAIFSS